MNDRKNLTLINYLKSELEELENDVEGDDMSYNDQIIYAYIKGMLDKLIEENN